MWKDLHLFNTTWAKHDQSCNLSGWICRQSARCMDRSCSGGPFVITSSLRTLSLASFGRSSGRAAASLGGPAPTWSQTCLRSTCSSQWKNKIKIKCSLQNSFFWCPTHIWAQNVQNEHFQVEELNQKCSLQNSIFLGSSSHLGQKCSKWAFSSRRIESNMLPSKFCILAETIKLDICMWRDIEMAWTQESFLLTF